MKKFEPTKEFKDWYKKIYGLDAREIIFCDHVLMKAYLRLLENKPLNETKI